MGLQSLADYGLDSRSLHFHVTDFVPRIFNRQHKVQQDGNHSASCFNRAAAAAAAEKAQSKFGSPQLLLFIGAAGTA